MLVAELPFQAGNAPRFGVLFCGGLTCECVQLLPLHECARLGFLDFRLLDGEASIQFDVVGKHAAGQQAEPGERRCSGLASAGCEELAGGSAIICISIGMCEQQGEFSAVHEAGFGSNAYAQLCNVLGARGAIQVLPVLIARE